jgi:hypothetical protein
MEAGGALAGEVQHMRMRRQSRARSPLGAVPARDASSAAAGSPLARPGSTRSPRSPPSRAASATGSASSANGAAAVQSRSDKSDDATSSATQSPLSSAERSPLGGHFAERSRKLRTLRAPPALPQPVSPMGATATAFSPVANSPRGGRIASAKAQLVQESDLPHQGALPPTATATARRRSGETAEEVASTEAEAEFIEHEIASTVSSRVEAMLANAPTEAPTEPTATPLAGKR